MPAPTYDPTNPLMYFVEMFIYVAVSITDVLIKVFLGTNYAQFDFSGGIISAILDALTVSTKFWYVALIFAIGWGAYKYSQSLNPENFVTDANKDRYLENKRQRKLNKEKRMKALRSNNNEF